MAIQNGIQNGYYHEITPAGFGLVIEAGEVLFSAQSEFQKVEVFETNSKLGRVLTLDDLMMTTEGDEFHYHEMIAHVPMMHHMNPESVLVIGGGDGGTIREVLKHKSVKKAVLCEIDGMVIDACKKFLPTIACDLEDARVEVKVEDAIEFIKDKVAEYDIVLIDSTDPMGPGEGLFTEEFYNNVKKSLKPNGIVAAQSESPVVNKVEIKKMYELLKKVFPICSTFTSNIPTYPGGYWAWAFCSETVAPLSYLDKERCEEITKTCKIYNKEYHNARFALPNHLKELL
ncbi:MAG: polyamine aminopropyltransferase [Candidatus Gastranaerophilales bacterium]